MTQPRFAYQFQKALALALTAPDPVQAVRRLARRRGLAPPIKRYLRVMPAAGVEMAALLVARLRFERLIRGCPDAEAWFERDAAAFAVAFRRYHAAVAPTAFFPPDEARLFRHWVAEGQRRAPSRVSGEPLATGPIMPA